MKRELSAEEKRLCTCLTAECAGELLHAARCDFARYAEPLEKPKATDDSDIRELAELAAAKDIDTALYIYRKHAPKKAFAK